MNTELFGHTPEGEAVHRITISGGGLTAKVLTWGAVIQDLRLKGHEPPLVLGYQAWTYYVFRRRVSRDEFTAPESARQETGTDAAVRQPVTEAEGKGP